MLHKISIAGIAMTRKQVVAIIPARGNSKRLPNKNIRSFLGRPLIAYAIDAAQNSKLIDRVIVSTESPKVAAIARKFGAEVFQRPAALAKDTTSMNAVIQNVLDDLLSEKLGVEAIVVLFPTAPLRTSADIDGAVRLARKHVDYESVASFCEAKVAPYAGLVQSRGRLSHLLDSSKKLYRYQDSPRLYTLNGAVWVLNPDRLNALNNNMLGDCTYGIEMPKERSIDIDTEFDFFIGECIAQRLWHRKRTAASQNVKAKRPK